jgi:DNA-directed RNA polymerase specialized sigma subunit
MSIQKRPLASVDEIFDDLETDADPAVHSAVRRPSASALDGHPGDDVETADLDRVAALSSVAGAFDDPDQSPELEDLDEEEISYVESQDLAAFGRAGQGRGFDDDAFEEWVRISRSHPPLRQAELDRYIALAHGDDEGAAREAEDKLIRHNVKWIVRCLRAHPMVGPSIMDMPGGLRDDALSLGRMGFLLGIRAYSPERALSVGKAGHKKTILKYGEYWIRKLAGEFMHQERFLLPEDASLDRRKVLSAIADLERESGRAPTDEEVSARLRETTLRRVALEDLRTQGARTPSEEQVAARIHELDQSNDRRLRRRGALLPARVRELREHQTFRYSLDTPVGGDGEDGPSLADYMADEGQSVEEMGEAGDIYRALGTLSAATDPTIRGPLSRGVHGTLAEDGIELHFPRTRDEIQLLTGRSRGSVDSYQREHLRALSGTREVQADHLTRRAFPFDLGRVREVLKAAARGGGDTEAAVQRLMSEIRDAGNLTAVLAEDGV